MHLASVARFVPRMAYTVCVASSPDEAEGWVSMIPFCYNGWRSTYWPNSEQANQAGSPDEASLNPQ